MGRELFAKRTRLTLALRHERRKVSARYSWTTSKPAPAPPMMALADWELRSCAPCCIRSLCEGLPLVPSTLERVHIDFSGLGEQGHGRSREKRIYPPTANMAICHTHNRFEIYFSLQHPDGRPPLMALSFLGSVYYGSGRRSTSNFVRGMCS